MGNLSILFDKVPARYDLLNKVMTLGMDARWRRLAVAECLAHDPARVLDLGCGTGDLALELAGRKVSSVVGADFSEPMLEGARRKAASRGLSVEWVRADAAALPFPDSSFDAVMLAFSFRNMVWRNANRDLHLGEMRRVLRPGGCLAIIESSQPANPLLRLGMHAWLRFFVSPLGSLLSDAPAYRYLSESARNFPRPTEISAMLSSAGFRDVRFRTVFFGVSAFHSALK